MAGSIGITAVAYIELVVRGVTGISVSRLVMDRRFRFKP
jgi:hypothetical protein